MKVHKTNAMRLLDSAGIDYEAIEYAHEKSDPIDAVSVAQSLGELPEKVFKTLVTKSGQNHFVFMIPADKELDLKKCAKAAGVKNLDMLPLKDLTKTTGYVRGGCSPLGMKKAFPVFIDESAVLQEDIYFSAGKIGMQIHTNPETFTQAFDIKYADLIKDH